MFQKLNPLNFKMFCMNRLLFLIIFSAFDLCNSQGSPPSLVIDEYVFDYLQRYGYIATNVSLATISAQDFTNLFKELLELNTGTLEIDLREMMNKSRCNGTDIRLEEKRRRKRFALSGNKWLAVPITSEKIKLNYSLIEQDDTNSPTVQMIDSASKLWTNVTDITFEWNQNQFSIIFNLSDEFEFEYNIKTVKYKPKYQPFIIEIHSNLTLNSVKFFNILVHTLGHALGLDHSSHTDSVMFPYISSNDQKNLTNDDIVAVQTLYGINGDNPDVNLLSLSPRADLSTDAPNLCSDPKIDSVLELHDNRWVFFKGEHYYEVGPFGQTMNSPRKIKWDFKEVETPIDATLNWNENILFFFKGNKYWKYQNNKFISHQNISEGFDNIPDGPFDDIFKWHINQKTYFFKGDQFWKYDSKVKAKGNYPKKISEYWRGIPDSFDAAISSRDRKQTYFFKDKKYYRFDDISKKVVDSTPPYPRNTNIYFFMCRNIPTTSGTVPKWSPRPTPPPIPQTPPIIETQSTKTPDLTTPPPTSHKDEDNEGWLKFLTIILGLFIIIILGTGSYATYLVFCVQINTEERSRSESLSNTRNTNQNIEETSDHTKGMPSTSQHSTAPTYRDPTAPKGPNESRGPTAKWYTHGSPTTSGQGSFAAPASNNGLQAKRSSDGNDTQTTNGD